MSVVAVAFIIIAVFFVIGVAVGAVVVYALPARKADRDSHSEDDDGNRPSGPRWPFWQR